MHLQVPSLDLLIREPDVPAHNGHIPRKRWCSVLEVLPSYQMMRLTGETC